MTIELDHTIVWAGDKAASAAFLADVLGLPVGAPVDIFLPLELANGVTLDFADSPGPVAPQHYAFLVTDAVFDAAVARLRAGRITYWADPLHQQPHQLNDLHGGRGVYFADPDRHNIELLTRS